MTFQNLDSSEISLTDVSHYFDNDPTKVVNNLRKAGGEKMAKRFIFWFKKFRFCFKDLRIGGPGVSFSSSLLSFPFCFLALQRPHPAQLFAGRQEGVLADRRHHHGQRASEVALGPGALSALAVAWLLGWLVDWVFCGLFFCGWFGVFGGLVLVSVACWWLVSVGVGLALRVLCVCVCFFFFAGPLAYWLQQWREMLWRFLCFQWFTMQFLHVVALFWEVLNISLLRQWLVFTLNTCRLCRHQSDD